MSRQYNNRQSNRRYYNNNNNNYNNYNNNNNNSPYNNNNRNNNYKKKGKKQLGIVKNWIMEKGYGFIQSTDGSDDVYVHANELENGYTFLFKGAHVFYYTKRDGNNKSLRAVDVEIRKDF